MPAGGAKLWPRRVSKCFERTIASCEVCELTAAGACLCWSVKLEGRCERISIRCDQRAERNTARLRRFFRTSVYILRSEGWLIQDFTTVV